MLQQHFDDASDNVLFENNAVFQKWVATPSCSNSIVTMESFENGLQPYPVATPLFSMRTELLASSQSCCSVDADAWCKRARNTRLC